MARWLVFTFGIATFLAAAKTHGRRLERLAGAGWWLLTVGLSATLLWLMGRQLA